MSERLDRFIAVLDTKRWFLYVPKPVFRAYEDNLLVWHIRPSGNSERVLSEVGFPFSGPRRDFQALPAPHLTSRTEWQELMRELEGEKRQRLPQHFGYHENVYRIRSFPIIFRHSCLESEAQESRRQEHDAEVRRLRGEFGLKTFPKENGCAGRFSGQVVAFRKRYSKEDAHTGRIKASYQMFTNPVCAVRVAKFLGFLE